ncbi:hypothetical protein DY000_02044952 [Brassica cretica]|uniref:Uncharacterized protein n=1 Tax=Brassica cretica TaxID=69181 RepID=A0ABQ7EQH7_BRACR|nr:hypothetical protein DY000_02044952 [Brassica cretica]
MDSAAYKKREIQKQEEMNSLSAEAKRKGIEEKEEEARESAERQAAEREREPARAKRRHFLLTDLGKDLMLHMLQVSAAVI